MNSGLFLWEKFAQDWLFAKWLIGFIVGATVLVLPTFKKSKILFTYLTYCLYSGIITYFADYGSDNILKKAVRPDLLFWLVALILGITFMYKAPLEKTKKAFGWLFWINALWLIIGTAFFGEPYAGIYCNISLSLTLYAILFSFSGAFESTKSYRLVLVFCSAAVIYLCHSLMGAVALIAAVSAVWFFKSTGARKYILLLLSVVLLTSFSAKEIYDRTKHLDNVSFSKRIDVALATSSRWSTWKLAWRAVHKSPQKRRLVSGYGYGSWSSLGLIIQAPKGFKKGIVYNIQMHNDIMQMIFEIGWAGLILWLALLGDMFRKALARKEWWIVYYLVALFVSSFGNFPRYLFIEHFAFFLVLKAVYFRKESVLDDEFWKVYNKNNRLDKWRKWRPS